MTYFVVWSVNAGNRTAYYWSVYIRNFRYGLT